MTPKNQAKPFSATQSIPVDGIEVRYIGELKYILITDVPPGTNIDCKNERSFVQLPSGEKIQLLTKNAVQCRQRSLKKKELEKASRQQQTCLASMDTEQKKQPSTKRPRSFQS